MQKYIALFRGAGRARNSATDCKDKNEFRKIYLNEQKFYLYKPEGFGRPKLAARVEKLLGVPATARNWNTVLKLAQLSDA